MRLDGLLISLVVAACFIPINHANAAPVTCECIRWLREVRGVDIRGDAWTLSPTKPLKNADIGDALLFDYGGKGKDHGAQIISFEGPLIDRGDYLAPEYINIIEANYNRCKVSYRKVRWDDTSIKGIYRKLPTTL